ncbi:hypothetical protein ANANG_G00244050 [Anguilla anguilla]|uniref:GH18 domain-containing protein n=1 Tax=Anguilla anguilla TaxID=7936 RepID=A0A9D3LQV2_ANGAN|nr:hypothetical protein ANANG_G00244050 [Anguilla anguilla]
MRCFANLFCLFTDPQELLGAYKAESRASGRPRLMVTAAVAAGKRIIDAGYEVVELSKYLDFINVMTFNFHESLENFTAHHSPLYRGSRDQGDFTYANADFAMRYWRGQGAPAEKLHMGFTTFGRSFTLSSSDQGPGAPARGSASAGPYVQEMGLWSYYEICSFIQGTTVQWIEEQQVPYAVKGDEWVGFDNHRSFEAKAQYLKNNNFGGAFVWALDMDDFEGQFCGQGRYPLINHLWTLLEIGLPKEAPLKCSKRRGTPAPPLQRSACGVKGR